MVPGGITIPCAVLVGNAVNHIETEGWTATDQARFLTQELGIPISHAILPKIRGPLPKAYDEWGWGKVLGNGYVDGRDFERAVAADLESFQRYIPNVEVTDILTYEDRYVDAKGPRDVIRHRGEVTADRIVQILDLFHRYPSSLA